MNLAYDLFLLTFNLSQLHDREKIIKLFLEGLQEIFKPAAFVFSENPVVEDVDFFELKSRQNLYGYITFQKHVLIAGENYVLICNAVQMVAVIVDNLEYGNRLEVERERLHKYADLKLLDLNKTVKELEDSRTASLNLIEDLNLEIERRRDAERAISKTEKYFRFLIENAPDGVVMVNSAGKMTYASPAARSIFGYPDGLIELPDPNESTHPEDLPLVLTTIQDLIQIPGKVSTIKYRFQNTEGKWLWVESTFTNHFADEGIEALIINFRDITDKKAAEDSLIESEEKFRRVFEDGKMSMALVDEKFRFIVVNEAFCRFTGYSGKELCSMTFRDITHPDHILTDIESVKKLYDGLIPYYQTEKRYITKEGIPVWGSVNISAIRDPEKKFLYFLAMVDDITEKKSADLALLESEEKFRNLFEHSPVGKSITGIDGTINVNKAFCNILGYSADELKAKNWKDISHPDDISATDKYVKSLISGKSDSARFEKRYLHKNGDTVFTDITTYLQRDSKGNPEYFITTISDITKRKIAEIKLQEEKERIRTILDLVGDPIFVKDNDHRITLANRAFYDLFCLNEADVIGYTLVEAVPEKERHHFLKVDRSVLDTGIPDQREEELTVKGLIHTIITRKIRFLDKSGERFLVGSIHDITDRKLYEEKLMASEERFSLVISASEQGIWDWNVETNEVFFSEQWKRQIGYEDYEIKNNFNSWIELLHPDEKESCQLAVQSYLNNPSEHFILEFRFRHKDGSYRIIHNKSASVKDKDGKVTRMFGTHTDITEKKLAEEEIIKLNETLEQRVIDRTEQLRAANSELEAFSYSVSHDLRAPLRAIHSFTRILKEDYQDKLDDEGKRVCGIIESSSVHMGQLIDDLLAFSRISRTEIRRSRIDMTKMVESILDELLSVEERKKLEFNVKKLPAAYGDSTSIRQVFINLISNAIKYSSKNDTPEITIGCEKNNNNSDNVYYVRDNGVGFDMQYADKLFRVFQRLHSVKEFEGNGVGLAIVHRILSRHGGKIWAEAEVGKGATFYFTLPDKGNSK